MKDVPSHNSRPFFDVAREIRRGVFLDECSDELQRVVQSVEETGKAAKLVIEITVSPAARVGGAVKVADKITTKLPALPAGETIMFVTPQNNLVANDPRQMTMELKAVQEQQAQPLQQAV